MAITKAAIKVGVKLTGKYKGTAHEVEVIKVGEDGIRFMLDGDRDHPFNSLSGAAVACTGHPASGFVFFSLATEAVEAAHPATSKRTPRPKGQARGSARASRAKAAKATRVVAESDPA
jgi:type IV secretory pathway VirB6-like protein